MFLRKTVKSKNDVPDRIVLTFWSLLMGDVAQRGMTVLISSHNLRELEDVCDHVGILTPSIPHSSPGGP